MDLKVEDLIVTLNKVAMEELVKGDFSSYQEISTDIIRLERSNGNEFQIQAIKEKYKDFL